MRSSRRSGPAGRSPSMFNKIIVDYYGTPTPLQQLASFTAPEARIIMIQPYDMGAMANVERAIRDSDLGVNPSNDGKVLRCVFPELTEERRKEYIKVARAKAEDGRVAVRNLRRTPSRASRSSRRTARSARTTSPAPRSGSTRSPRSTPTRSTRCSRTRKPSCSRSETSTASADDRRHPPRRPPRTTAAPAATCRPPSAPPSCCSARSRLSLVFWKPAFMVIVVVAVVVAIWELRQGLLAKDIDLPEQPLMLGGVVMVVVAYLSGHQRPGHRHRRHRAGHDAVAAAPRHRRLRQDRHGLGLHPDLRAVPRARSSRCCWPRAGAPAPASTTTAWPASSPSSWSPSPPTSAATSPACSSASTRWRR